MWLISSLVLCTVYWLLLNGDNNFAEYFANLYDAVLGRKGS